MPNIGIAAVGAAVVALSAPAAAQEWPARPVTMVVPFAAGGSPDILARILAPRLSELLGQQVIVENVGGAGGSTAATRLAKAAPDGYQFILGNSGTHAITDTLYRQPPYRAESDFRAGRPDRRVSHRAYHPQGFAGERSQGIRRPRA